MKIQTYVTSIDDVKIVANAGFDFIGAVVDESKQTPSSLSFEEVKNVFSSIPEGHFKVALTFLSTAFSIQDLMKTLKPNILHLACNARTVRIDLLEQLKSFRPSIKIMQAIPMNTDDPLKIALRLQSICDYFILDTNDPTRVDVGATGCTHDWSKSAELVKKVSIPIILAGGLSPENVAEAIEVVRPWGVDSFTHTNILGTVKKDEKKSNAFVKAARRKVNE
jgi:phosphoribosylanthranilate isomerase